MKIGIANDHHGVELKNKIIDYLNKNNIEVINYGCDEKNNIDYTEYAIKLCNSINNKEVELGILICGTGIGMSIIANKIKGIICAKVTTEEEAMLAKNHNRANVIALGENTQNYEQIVSNFINTENSNEERHIRRYNRIIEIQDMNI